MLLYKLVHPLPASKLLHMDTVRALGPYFVRGSITVQLASCLTGLDSATFVTVKLTTELLIWLNPNH